MNKPVSNKQMKRAFEAALQYLSPTHHGSYEFICFCLEHAHASGKISERTVCAAKNLIHERLECHATLGCWLRACAGIPEYLTRQDRHHNDGRKMQAARRAWLESLIKEFS